MSKNLVTILLLTFITATAWITFQIFKIATRSTITAPTQKQIEKLDQAHKSGDSGKFNIIKKQVLELQRKIHSLI